jgi:hypothetical protein
MWIFNRFTSSLKLLTAAVASIALLSFAPAADAATYVLDGNFGGDAVNLEITTSNTLDSAGGYDITGITGSIAGFGSVSSLTGSNGGYSVVSGLYINPNQPNPFTIAEPPLSGGADYIIDNVWFSSAPYLDSDGVGFLLADGYTVNLWGNSPGSYTILIGAYNLYSNNDGPVSVTATPLPPTWTLLVAGFIGFGFFAFRSTKTNATAAA